MDRLPRRPLGRTQLSLTQTGLGTAPLGNLNEELSEQEAWRIVEAAYILGIRFFDTSPYYGHGLSEHRVGAYLRSQPRDSFIISTKVGRVFSRPPPGIRAPDTSPWVRALPFVFRFDYTYDGIMRSFEDSLLRLGLSQVDLVVIHDLDFLFHGSVEGVNFHLNALENGGWKALHELKSCGDIKGIGAGINHLDMIPRFLDRFEMDFFLVAMPYTLLDQGALEEEFPLCLARQTGIIVGSPYASGILATGPVRGARYNYKPATEEVQGRVRAIRRICKRHGVPLRAAALRFPLGHPLVASVIPGARSTREVRDNIAMMRIDIAKDLWQELKAEGFLRADAPTP
jgi:D-threo-aldose 1-dehydrogenase